MAKPLRPKQARFVDEYLIDLNGTQSAIRAGYSAKSAKVTASQLLTYPNIQAALTARRQAIADTLEVTPERIIAEYAKLGFSDMRHFSRWGPRGVSLVPSDELSDDDAACVAEVSEHVYESEHGSTRQLKFKLHDKKGALDSLAKHLGMFIEKHEHTVTLLDKLAQLEAMSDLELQAFLAELQASRDQRKGHP